MTAMVRSRFQDTPTMPEFNVSNDLIGDRAALDAAWERDGYWFFRGVLDRDAVARARAEFIEVLEGLGVVALGCTDEAIYNGAPLAPITEETGGLALTEGLHKPRLGDFPRPPSGIQLADVPADAWRRTTYEPGDLLVFSLESPHSGLANRSATHFRLSMDIRGMRKSDNVPVIGTVAGIDHNGIAVDDEDGVRHVFRIDEDTFCRVYRAMRSGMPLARGEIPELVKVGAPVYVASRHGTATFIRPQH